LLSNMMPTMPSMPRRAPSKKHKKFVDIVLGFRGTDSSVNVKLDLKFKRLPVSASFWYGRGEHSLGDVLTQSISWKKYVRADIVRMDTAHSSLNPLNLPNMKIHSGFYQSFADIRQRLLQTVLSLYTQIMRRKRTPRFYISGHSLGGALAQLCALWMDILFGHRSPVFVYVFGCPRVGDPSFAQCLTQRVKHCYRVVFRGDVITTIPRGFAYYKHAGWEIIVDHLGNMINAPSKREKALLPSRTSFADHGLQFYMDSLNLIAKKHRLQHLVLTQPDNDKNADTDADAERLERA